MVSDVDLTHILLLLVLACKLRHPKNHSMQKTHWKVETRVAELASPNNYGTFFSLGQGVVIHAARLHDNRSKQLGSSLFEILFFIWINCNYYDAVSSFDNNYSIIIMGC